MQQPARAYELHRLAVGSFDLVLGGDIIGSVVREVAPAGQEKGWCAELLEDLMPDQRPAPFTATEHSFRSLGAVTAWLGGAPIIEG
ncbi:hypothetical protein HCU64_23740 [Methylobacterium sp. C25]|uniref:hypothetical protein n=1 Tax=Methylobacterium sp. C25 TaxID=2721622 RepID=UPI001F173B7F|nr:hypothetical protein [Methylobacterium sp. C25]MCE4226758.1 hypothetical protein [Methylobacterium sp. C25]